MAKAQYAAYAQQPQPQQQIPYPQKVANVYGEEEQQLVDPEHFRKLELRVDKSLLGGLHDLVKTRRYAATFTFSCFEAAQDPSLVRVKATEGDIFRMRSLDPYGKTRAGKLENGIVVNARVLHASSDCAVALGLKLSGIRGNTYHLGGKRCALPLFPGSKHRYGQRGLCIHRLTDKIDVRNIDRYGHLTMDSVKSTVLVVPGEDFSFVEIRSPVMDIIAANEQMLKVDLTKFGTVKGKYYVVNNDVVKVPIAPSKEKNPNCYFFFQVCLDTIEREFFQRMPFTVRLLLFSSFSS